jgi:hypothetical protein
MATGDPEDLVSFQDVRVIRSTVPALLCRIGERSIWLSRDQISGKLWSTGDRGKLFIRRRVARDRHLIDLHGTPVQPRAQALPPLHLLGRLHLVRGDHHAK